MNDDSFDSKSNDDNSCVTQFTQFEGYLFKKSQHLKSLRCRWIVLDKNYLYSYTGINDVRNKNIRSTFDLSIYDKITSIDYNQNNHPYSFKIISSKTKQEREFITKTKKTQETWFSKIKLAQDIWHKRIPVLCKCNINQNWLHSYEIRDDMSIEPVKEVFDLNIYDDINIINNKGYPLKITSSKTKKEWERQTNRIL